MSEDRTSASTEGALAPAQPGQTLLAAATAAATGAGVAATPDLMAQVRSALPALRSFANYIGAINEWATNGGTLSRDDIKRLLYELRHFFLTVPLNPAIDDFCGFILETIVAFIVRTRLYMVNEGLHYEAIEELLGADCIPFDCTGPLNLPLEEARRELYMLPTSFREANICAHVYAKHHSLEKVGGCLSEVLLEVVPTLFGVPDNDAFDLPVAALTLAGISLDAATHMLESEIGDKQTEIESMLKSLVCVIRTFEGGCDEETILVALLGEHMRAKVAAAVCSTTESDTDLAKALRGFATDAEHSLQSAIGGWQLPRFPSVWEDTTQGKVSYKDMPAIDWDGDALKIGGYMQMPDGTNFTLVEVGEDNLKLLKHHTSGVGEYLGVYYYPLGSGIYPLFDRSAAHILDFNAPFEAIAASMKAAANIQCETDDAVTDSAVVSTESVTVLFTDDRIVAEGEGGEDAEEGGEEEEGA